MKDWTMQLQYKQEIVEPDKKMKCWQYVGLTQEKINEILSIEEWNIPKIQEILKTL